MFLGCFVSPPKFLPDGKADQNSQEVLHVVFSLGETYPAGNAAHAPATSGLATGLTCSIGLSSVVFWLIENWDISFANANKN